MSLPLGQDNWKKKEKVELRRERVFPINNDNVFQRCSIKENQIFLILVSWKCKKRKDLKIGS